MGPASLFALDPHRTLTQYARAVWTQAQGLPQDFVQAIAQTSDGYLWLGTDEGLTRFDGYDFVTFTKEMGALPSNTVTDAGRRSRRYALDRHAQRIVSLPQPTVHGVYRERRASRTNPSPPSAKITTARCGLPLGSNLASFANGKFTNYPIERLQPLTTVRTVYEDRHNRLFIAGMGGLVELRGQRFVPVFGPKRDGRANREHVGRGCPVVRYG